MPLPTTTIETGTSNRPAINRDFNDLDSLISELATPKEQIFSSTRTAPGNDLENGSSTIDNYDTEAQEPMPAEIAALSGKAIAGTIDTVLSTGFSLYAKSSTPEKYEANDKQIEKLNQAWGAVAQKYNYKIEDSPWFNVILLTIAVYLPIWKEAQKDHRFAEVDERLAEQERMIRENEARLKILEAQQKPA